MPTDQLLTKTVFFERIPEIGVAEDVRKVKFHLPRGYIARVLGFAVAWIIQLADADEPHALDVTKGFPKIQGRRPPPDALWSSTTLFGAGQEQSIVLPKPYRCTALGVRAWCIDSNLSSLHLIIYYDLDRMSKDEDVPILESSRQRSHRAIG